MPKILALAGTAIAVLAAVPSMAANYILTYTSTNAAAPFSANLYVNTSDDLNSVGGYDILGISGDVDGDVITGLVPNPNQPNSSNSADGSFIYDNVLRTDAPQLSSPGVLFTSATLEYNLFSDDATTFELYTRNDSGLADHSTGTLTVSQVPEPASWAMMVGGFGVLGGAMRRQRRQSVATTFA